MTVTMTTTLCPGPREPAATVQGGPGVHDRACAIERALRVLGGVGQRAGSPSEGSVLGSVCEQLPRGSRGRASTGGGRVACLLTSTSHLCKGLLLTANRKISFPKVHLNCSSQVLASSNAFPFSNT